MKYRFSVAQESRRKAILFANNGEGTAPVGYAQIQGHWVDVYNNRNPYRAEFGPFLSKGEADTVGVVLVSLLNDGHKMLDLLGEADA